jgi:hypothetical protein
MSKYAPQRPSELVPRRRPRHDARHATKGRLKAWFSRKRHDADEVAERMSEVHDDRDLGVPRGPR